MNRQGQEDFTNVGGSQINQMIEKLDMENPNEYANLVKPMKKSCGLKYREYIREACAEYQRRGNFIRIYPAKNSDTYD
jgi:hypothetical protein